MKLKKKLIICILITFTANISLLFVYYQLSLQKTIEKEQEKIQLDLDKYAKFISYNIEKNQSLDNISTYIKDIEHIEYINIEVENEDKKVIYEYKTQPKSYLNITAINTLNLKGDYLIVKVQRPVQMNNIQKLPFLKYFLIAEIVIFSSLMFVMIGITYYNFLKPILYLQKDIENYKFNLKPKRTNRKDEIGWLKNNFVELTEELEKEKANQNRIIASISHDIKNPLTSIMGYAERLENKEMTKERRDKYTSIIYSKAQHIKNLIDEFDDYLGNGMDDNIHKQCISVDKLYSIVEEEYKDELNQLNIEFNIKKDCKNSNMEIDISKIRRVFGNIIENSIKHMNKEVKKIYVTFKDNKDNIIIYIEDNGCGVKEEDLTKIFETLYTSDKTRQVAGLGLSICKSIVEMHGGNIYAKNNIYGGLSIIFTLKKAHIN